MTATSIPQVDKNGTGRIVETLTIVFATNATTITKTFEKNCTILDMFISPPSTIDGTQYTINILDEDGDIYYTSGLLTKGTTANHIVPGVSVAGITTIQLVTATNQTANRIFTVKAIIA